MNCELHNNCTNCTKDCQTLSIFDSNCIIEELVMLLVPLKRTGRREQKVKVMQKTFWTTWSMKAMQHNLAVVEILQGNIYRIRTIENNSKALQLSQGLLLKKSNNH